jgi:hypothetical protein
MNKSCSGCKYTNKPQYGHKCGKFVGIYYGCDLGCYVAKECKANGYNRKENNMRCPTNAQIIRGASEWYDEHTDDYYEAKDEEFDAQFRDEFMSELGVMRPITEEDLQGFLDSFDFPDQEKWLANEYESYIGGIHDQCYDEYKDRDI